MKHPMTRRKLLKTIAAASVVPFVAFGSNEALAQTAHVDPAGAQAKALGYVHQSSMADKDCGNCKLYSGTADQEWGPCAIFPGQNVAARGWCQAWSPKS